MSVAPAVAALSLLLSCLLVVPAVAAHLLLHAALVSVAPPAVALVSAAPAAAALAAVLKSQSKVEQNMGCLQPE